MATTTSGLRAPRRRLPLALRIWAIFLVVAIIFIVIFIPTVRYEEGHFEANAGTTFPSDQRPACPGC